MTFCMSRKHRLWKHAKETLLVDMHSQVLSLCGSIKYKRWRWAKRASLNHKETHVKGEYESKHILTCIERLCANMVVVSFLCMVLLNYYQSGLRVEDWGGIEIGTKPNKTKFVIFHTNEFLMWYQKSLSCWKDRNLKDMIYIYIY